MNPPSLIIAILLLVPQCAVAQPQRSVRITVELPPSLEATRPEYELLIGSAREEVLAWFRGEGLPMEPKDLIDRAVVYPDTESARRAIAEVLGIDLKDIPDTFGGTVNGKTLYLTSEQGFRPSWTKRYPDWPWSRRTYQSLIVHELAHRAHAHLASRRTGSEDAMGPSWFFEGLAVMCARQFTSGERAMGAAEILSHVGPGKSPPTSYPLYGNLVRSLARFASIKTLVESADEPDFPLKVLDLGGTRPGKRSIDANRQWE